MVNAPCSTSCIQFFQNPVDRVPVHDKFKATELFTNKYGISLQDAEDNIDGLIDINSIYTKVAAPKKKLDNIITNVKTDIQTQITAVQDKVVEMAESVQMDEQGETVQPDEQSTSVQSGEQNETAQTDEQGDSVQTDEQGDSVQTDEQDEATENTEADKEELS